MRALIQQCDWICVNFTTCLNNIKSMPYKIPVSIARTRDKHTTNIQGECDAVKLIQK